MLNRSIKSIHRFRIFLTAIIVLSFFKLAGAGPLDVGAFLGAQAGRAIGMSTSVPENPFNRLAVQLKEKEESLNEREKALDERERTQDKGTAMDPALFWTFLSGIFILFMLVGVNFYHDALRRRKQETRAKEEER